MTSVRALIKYAPNIIEVTNYVTERLDMWRVATDATGKFKLKLIGDFIGQFDPDDPIQIRLNDIIFFEGYIDRGLPLAKGEVYQQYYELVGRDYAQDLLNKQVNKSPHDDDSIWMYNEDYADEIIDDMLFRANSEITFTPSGDHKYGGSDEAIPQIIYTDMGDESLLAAFRKIFEKIDYDFYVDEDKALHIFPIGSIDSGITLSNIANSASNNLLDLKKTEFDTYDVKNYIIAKVRKVDDGWTDGNATDFTTLENNTLSNDPVHKIKGIGSIKCVKDEGENLMIELDFTGGKFNYDYLPMELIVEDILRFEFKQHQEAGPPPYTQGHVRLVLEDNESRQIEWSTSNLDRDTWHQITVPVGGKGKGVHIEPYLNWNGIIAQTVVNGWRNRNDYIGDFTWKIKKIIFYIGQPLFPNTGIDTFWIDNLTLPFPMVSYKQEEKSLLTTDANQGQTACVVADGTNFSEGQEVMIKDNDNYEFNTIATIVANTLVMTTNLTNTYYLVGDGYVIDVSQSKYGIRKYTFTPRNIRTQRELDEFTEAQLAKLKNPICSIHVTALGSAGIIGEANKWIPGHMITVNSPEDDINNEEYRMTNIHYIITDEGIQGHDFIVEADLIPEKFSISWRRLSSITDPKITSLRRMSERMRYFEQSEELYTDYLPPLPHDAASKIKVGDFGNLADTNVAWTRHYEAEDGSYYSPEWVEVEDVMASKAKALKMAGAGTGKEIFFVDSLLGAVGELYFLVRLKVSDNTKSATIIVSVWDMDSETELGIMYLSPAYFPANDKYHHFALRAEVPADKQNIRFKLTVTKAADFDLYCDYGAIVPADLPLGYADVTLSEHLGTDTSGHAGGDTDAHGGTDTNAHAGTDTNAHSGTDTDSHVDSSAADGSSTYATVCHFNFDNITIGVGPNWTTCQNQTAVIPADAIDLIAIQGNWLQHTSGQSAWLLIKIIDVDNANEIYEEWIWLGDTSQMKFIGMVSGHNSIVNGHTIRVKARTMSGNFVLDGNVYVYIYKKHTHTMTNPSDHSLTQPSNHSITQPSNHSVTQPSNHTVTQAEDHSITQAEDHTSESEAHEH